ncbi:MAG TPA: right-handed parallel beta-helix repeat-containing protein [Pyrinomonadaceae bacterium]|nr:right-handed parallel beta-helix repeat-containing protein [Pyrinomonadaceae bacterium]
MSKVRFTLNILAIAIFTLTVASMAQAQATRTWVSGVGDDVNPCSRTAPCKTYAGAISKTAKDGEISTLDPGGFGTVTITKSITINGGNGGQGYGSILSALAPAGVTVNITDAADVRKSVKLDWLNINGASTGTSGIRFLAGNVLHVENCLIDGMTSHGIDANFSAANAATKLSVHNTIIRNCAGTGIRTNAFSGGQIKSAISNCHITNCGTGIDQVNGTIGSIHDCMISLCGTGIQTAEPTAGSVANVDTTSLTNNSGTALNVVGSSRIRIANCFIAQNNVSLAPAANVDSGGNNNIVGNNTNTAPAGTPFNQN